MRPEKTHSATTPISFWLMPAEPARQELTLLINFLADKYHAPRFLPHVTVLSMQLPKNQTPQQILQTSTSGFAPFKLDILGLEHGPDRFKSIFVRLNSRPIMPLYDTLRASCRNPGNYRLDAHLSLLYLLLPVAERITLVSKLKIPQGPLFFDTITAVTPGRNQRSFADVEKWQCIEQIVLSADSMYP